MIGENRRVAAICLSICTVITSLGWMYLRLPQFYEKYVNSFDAASWLLSAYIIAEVSMVIIAGIFIDRIGSKHTMLIGIVLFVSGAMGVFVTQSFNLMIIYRIVQGLGAGFIFTVGVAFIPKAYDKSDRPNPHKIMTLAFSLGSIFGTAVGRYFLIDLHDWKLFMLISALIILIIGGLAYLTLCNQKRELVRDIPGIVLTISTIASIMCYTQTVNINFNLVSAESFAFLEFCLIQVFLLIWVEKKSKNPILPQGIKRTHFGLLAEMFLAGFCGLGMLQFLTMFMIVYYGLPITNAICMLLCMICGGAIVSLIGMSMVYRTGVRPFAITGPIIIVIGFIGAYFLITKGLFFMGASMFVIGMGFGCIVTEMVLSIQATSPLKDVGVYTALLMSLRFVGIILGMAVYDHLILGPVRDYIRDVKGQEVMDVIGWLLNHYSECVNDLLSLFETAVQNCCIIAGVTVIIVLIIAYFTVGTDDIDAPERNE